MTSFAAGAMARLSLDDVRALAHRVLAAHGFSADHVAAIGELVVAAEADGCPSHGLLRLIGYVGAERSGRINPRANPTFEQTAPAAVLIDGDGGYSTLPVRRGVAPLIERARSFGIATLLVRNSHHLGALWYDVEPLAAAGLIAMAFVAARPVMSVFGSRERQLGTNPLAFACPRRNGPPLVCDLATSAAARGELMLAAREGRPIPADWAQDAEGQPTQDAQRALEGTMLPFGNGPKGSSIALMVELFAVIASGGRFGFEALAADQGDGGPLATGQTIIALDPQRLGAGAPDGRMDALVDYLRRSAALRLPGDRRLAMRARSGTEGVTVRRALIEEIETLASVTQTRS